MKLLSNHVIFLPHLKTFMPHHPEASHVWPPTKFHPHPSAHLFGPCIHCGKFVAAFLQPQFYLFYASLLALPSDTRLACEFSMSLLPRFSGLFLFLSVFQLFFS